MIMGAPGIQPHYVTEQVKQDPLSDDIRTNLVAVSGTAHDFLKEALLEASQLLTDPNASIEKRQKVAEKLQRLTEGAQAATESIEHFNQAESLEKKIVDTALEDSHSSDDIMHAGIVWQQQAADYYNNSKSSLLKVGQAVSPEMAFQDPAVQRSFWKRVADAALGIEVLIERVNSLPERLAESVKEGFARRIDAVNDTFSKWARQTENKYMQLRNQTQDVANEIVDHSLATVSVLGGVAKTLGGKIMRGGEKVENSVSFLVWDKILNPLSNFLETKVTPALREVGKNLYDNLSEQVRQTSMDYKNVLQKRKAEREKTPEHALTDEVFNDSAFAIKPMSLKTL